jgi:hypothetical protein
MTDQQQHSITPPHELVREWASESLSTQRLCAHAAQWGYEQRGAVNEDELQKARDEELEACCEWLISNQNPRWAAALQEGRRPKPKSQAEEALEALEAEDDDRPLRSLKTGERFDTIRRALKRLRELEGSND